MKKNNFADRIRRQAKINMAISKKRDKDSKFKIPEEEKENWESDEEDFFDKNDDFDEDYKLPPAQRPESFHRFILENEYEQLEREIRGLKDVWDKYKGKYVTKKADNHCFTDEESEFIVRIVQTHLTTTIKLSTMTREQFDIKLMAIYESIQTHFKEITEYKFGRFKGYNLQMEMKRKALAIFTSIMSNIFANYSRSVEGMENKATHDSVRGQESLQQTDENKRDIGYT